MQSDIVRLNESKNDVNHCVMNEFEACSSYSQTTLDRHEALKEDADSFLNDGLKRVIPTGKLAVYFFPMFINGMLFMML